MLFSRSSLIASTLAVLCFQTSQAHVSLSPKFAEPGVTNFTTSFNVPHGCNGSSTISIQVTVPEEITTLSPQAISNWTLSTTYRDSANTTVDSITWSGGPLSATSSLGFPVVLNVPNEDLSSRPNVTLYFPVIQTCEVGVNEWTTTNGSNVGEPAPALVIVKNATAAASSAIAMTSHAAATGSGHASATSTPSGTSGSTSGAGRTLTSFLPLIAAAAAAVANF